MAVLLDTARHGLVFTHHTGNIPHTYHLSSSSVAIDNLFGNLLFAVLHRLDMDGNLLVVVADAATHGRDALGLETREKHLLTDAVGLQPLAVYVKRYLLLLFAKEFDVGNRGNATKAVAEVVAVLFQFTVAALVALNGNEQGRGVAEVVVDYKCQHTAWQLHLEVVQTMLDLAPHLVLVVHFIVQTYHHDTHAILRCGGGLDAIHLAERKQIAL